MREKNRKPIASNEKLPQFTTMNVIDGQAGLVNYSSLIFYSLTIDNILNIIVLLILAGVSIAMLTGENGILTQAQSAKNETDVAQSKEETTIGQYESYINRLTGTNAIVGEIVTGGNKPYTNNGTAIIPEGFMIVPGCDDVSQGLVISDNPSDTEVDSTNIVANGNQFVWIPVTSESQYLRNTTYIDTNVSANAYTDTGYLPEGIQPNIPDTITDKREEGIINEQREKEIVLSVGGFYISRYEAGVKGEKLVSQKGVNVWDEISQENAKETAKMFINNGNVKSALCSGIQWDITMNFVNGKKDGTNIIFDVTKYDSRRHTGNSLPAQSGENEADKVCNIYDLEGNCWEYVAERGAYYNLGPFIGRAGSYLSSNTSSASRRYDSSGIANIGLSFRFVLYVI